MLARYAGLTEEFLCCCYCGLSGIWQDPWWKNMSWEPVLTPPNLFFTTVRNVCTMKFWLRLKQLQSWSQNEVALAILKKDRYMF